MTPDGIYQLISALIFAGIAGTTIAGALIAACSRRLVYCVSGLAVSSAGLAGLYYYLNSPFLTWMQILIYVGAVCVTIMFALMLTDQGDEKPDFARTAMMSLAGLLAGIALVGVLLPVISKTVWMKAGVKVNQGTVQDLGRELLNRYGFPFELLSVVLLLAIIGAVLVARNGRRKQS